MTKRRQISLLPFVHQTEDLKRFFNSTVDQLFEEGKTVPVSGYIGRKPAHYDAAKDFYKPETTPERERYQLEPMMVSHDENRNVISSLFYEDLIANLSQMGALVNDPNRLFGAGYYSWAPPIDIDRIMNFQQYYWSGLETNALVLTVPGVEVGAKYYGDGFIDEFAMPPKLASRTVEEEVTVVLINGMVIDPAEYAVANNKVTFDDAPPVDSSIVIFRYGNVGDDIETSFKIPAHCPATEGSDDVYVFINGREITEFTVSGDNVVLDVPPSSNSHVMVTRLKDLKARIEGNPQFDPSGLTLLPVTELVEGMKLKLIDPINFAFGYDLKAYGHPWDELGHNTFFVEGVDIAIVLIPIEPINFSGDGFAADDPRYIVIARTDPARSFWSRVNRWVHKDALIDPADAKPELQAKRPIIEFLPNLQQFNYGTYRVSNSSGKISTAPRYNENEISFSNINGIPEGELIVDDGFRPQQGDVLFVNFSDDTAHNNRLYRVDVAQSDGIEPVSLIVLEPLEILQEGAVTQIKEVEYWYDGRIWHPVPEPEDAPLFDLFDKDGISLGDVGVYPETNFTGSRIFGFADGTGRRDSILKKALRYDKFGQIVFENELHTRTYSYEGGEIGGYYYYKRADKFLNAWHKADDALAQAIDENNVSDIPLNLQANPDFETPEFLSRNDFFEHFASILKRQDAFEGQPYSRNNWYKTAKDVTKGLVIIQHEAPLLKLMALMAEKRFNLGDAMRFVEREYTRLKAKFIKHVMDLSLEEDITILPADTLAVKALNRLNAGKTTAFPFHDTGVGGGNYFIPVTPSLLGINPLVEPALITDDTFGQDVTFIRGHDGSMTAAWGDVRDDAMLAFEQRIYTNALAVQEKLRWDDIVGGAFRTADYSEADATDVMMPWFERWARENDAKFENVTFDANDPFTWNYRTATDRYGNTVPGHWRGIYLHFFDTDRPHLAPWEMLGFAEKPAWWETFYGPAPYTRSNSVLWDDIAAGIIRDGDRAGTHAKYVRDDLMQILPVGLNGELLDPITATIIPVAPPVVFAEQAWTFGDGSNIEAVWRMTSNYAFARAFAKFLMRPAYFVEVFWDILNEAVVHENQKVQTPAYRRVHHSELLVHGEEDSEGNEQVNFGIQNWLVDYMRLGGSNSVPLGEAIRGVKAQLGHKVAGFTTKDRMTISAESFGLVPDEDITISLYRSPSLTDYFYSGIIVENTAGGYRVVGYNPDYPFFDVILGEEHSRKEWIEAGAQPPERAVYPWKANVHYKQNMLIEHQNTVYRCETAHTSASKFEKDYWKVTNLPTKHKFNRVYRHTKSSGVHARIEYGTILQTKQEVADLMFGYERYLRSQGFVFAEERKDNGSFFKAVKNFIKWAMVEWKVGAFVSLSPAARKLTFRSPTGIVVQMENSVIDRTGHFIRKGNFSVDRSEDITEITAHTDDIYGARLSRTEIEHALVFSNETIFGDVIFNPLYNIRQYRLKLSARVAPNWVGRYEAPGFVIDGDAIQPNFVKLGEDVREMFDIELADNTVLRDHARHVIGFETREYLDKLLLNETQQFEMYQGMIQQKGSAGAMSAILRSGEIAQSRDLQFLEEWAFRVGDFGAFHPELTMELTIEQADIHSERQLVHLNAEGRDDWLNVTEDRWVSDAANFTELLVPQTTEALPDAGYARTDEATYMVRDLPAFSDYVREGNTVAEGQTIWTTHTDNWGMYRVCWPTADLQPLEIQSIIGNDAFGEQEGFRITFDRAHIYVPGNTIIIAGGDYRAFWGAYEVARAGDVWVELDVALPLSIDFEELEAFEVQPVRPVAYITRPLRVANTAARNALPAYPNGTMSYVDDVSGKWVVYKKIANNWVEQRRQPKKIETKSITQGLIWDQKTEIEPEQLQVEPAIAERLMVIDPLAGLIAGVVDKELDFKLEYDPANYDEWDSTQVGYLWWDLSTARFLNPYTDAIEEFESSAQRYEDELVYRNENWAKLTKTSSVDVYEWTRSLVAPAEGVSFVQRAEYDVGINKSVEVYYFWKLNAETTPLVHQRRISARSCSQIIANPAKSGVVWYSPVAPNAFLVAGTHGLFDDDGRVMQIKYRVTDYEGEEHFEWTLMRPGDKTNAPPTPLWNKLMDSSRGYDLNLRKLPSLTLHPTVRSGLGVKQSMFGDVPNKDARNSLITMLNYILSRTNHATVGNLTSKLSLGDNPPEYLYWSAYTDDLPLLPPQIEYDIVVHHEDEIEGALNQSNRVLFDNRGGDVPSWSIWHRNSDGVPAIRRAYDYEVANRSELHDIFLEMNFKDRVLVRNDEEAFGFWTIWEKRGDGAWDIEPFDQFLYDGFTDATLGLVNAQKYRTSDFWEYYDWYAEGEDADVPPGIVYATPEQRNVKEGLNPTNTFVKVLDDKDHWSWSRWNGDEWVVVARELSTVQLSENFFTKTKLYGILNEQIHLNLADIPFRDGTLELSPLINAVREHLLTVEEVNELWFSMIHFIHSRIEKVDWALKTSFINVMGFNERMWASPVAVTENMPLLLEYIAEVKPYRTKIRDVLRTAAPDLELAETTVTDFDKPVYWDHIVERFRVLDEVEDADILSEGLYRHYTEVPENRRKFLMSVKWDRIWGENIEGSGAAERIMSFYQPGSNMRRQSLSDLLDLDFKGTIYDGSVFGDTDLDLILQGSNGDGSQIKLGGFKLRDPHVAPNRPEELAAVGTHDGLLIRSHDRWTAGAPLHTVRHFDVERLTGTSATFDIDAICESVAVFVNGIRYDSAGWTHDMLSHTITVQLDAPAPIGRAKTVAIHGFGFAGAERIREQRYYAGGQTEYEFEDAAGGAMEVRINGQLVDEADFTVNTNSVVLANPTVTSDSIILTLYTTNDPEPTRMRWEELLYNTNKEWQLTADQLPTLRPYHAAIIVEKNGLRLTPPRTYYARNVLAYFVDHDIAADIRVYDNRLGQSFPVVDIADIDNVTVFETEYEIREISDERFILWEKNIVFGDPEAATSEYTIVVNVGGDFTITDGGLLSIPAATNTDEIKFTKWDNDQLMDMRTHVFTGNPEGFYNLTTTRNGRTWLTIDGKRLVENVDYVIEEKEAGSWDIDPFERFSYDSYRLVQLAIRFPGEQPPKDVVISTFEGREAHPARVWQISTKAPEEMRLVLDEETQMRVMVKKAWELAGLDYIRRSGALVDAIEPESNTITLELNPMDAPAVMIPPQPIAVPANEQPEVIWIRGERIEYFGFERSANTVTLTELRRGTRGTSMTAHDAGQIALAIHDLDRMPPAPKAPPRLDDPTDPTIDSSIKITFTVEGEGTVVNPVGGVALQNMTMAIQGFNSANQYQWTNNEMQDSFLYNEHVDGGDNIILAGEHSSNATLNADAMIAKYDGVGVIQWMKTVNAGVGGQSDAFWCATSDSANNVIAFGSLKTSATERKGSMFKFAPDGSLLLQKVFNYPTVPTRETIIYKAINDGTHSYVVGWQNGANRHFLMKLDGAGDIVWQKLLNDTTDSFGINDLTFDNSGNVIVLYMINGTAYQGFLKYAPDGTLVWNKAVETSYFASWDTQGKVTVDATDNIYACVDDWDTNSTRVIKLDSAGDLQWSKRFYQGDAGGAWYFELTRGSVHATDAGVFVISHMTSYNSSGIIIVQIDPTDGDILNQRMLNVGGAAGSYPAPFTSIASGNKFVVAGSYFTTAFPYGVRKDYTGCFVVPQVGEVKFGDFGALSDIVAGTNYEVHTLSYADTQVADTSTFGIAPVSGEDLVATTSAYTVVDVAAPVWGAASVTPMEAYSDAGDNWALNYGFGAPITRYLGGFAADTDIQGNLVVASYDEGVGSPMVALTKFDPDGSVIWERKMAGPSSANDMHVIRIDKTTNDIFLLSQDTFNDIWSMWRFNSQGVQQYQRRMTGLNANTFVFDDTYIYVTGQTPVSSAVTTLFKLQKSDGALVAQVTLGSLGETPYSINFADDGSLLLTAGHFQGGVTTAGRRLTLWNLSTSLTTVNWQRRLYITAGSTNNHSYGGNTFVDGSDIYVIGDQFTNTITPAPPAALTLFAKFDDTGAFQFHRVYGSTDGTITVLPTYGSGNVTAVRLDGDFVVLGNIYESGIYNYDFALMRFDVAGDLVSAKRIGSMGTNGEQSYALTTDGTFLYISARQEGDTYTTLLMKLHKDNIVNGTYGTFTITDLSMNEYTDVVTVASATHDGTAPAVSAYSMTAGTYAVSNTNPGLITTKQTFAGTAAASARPSWLDARATTGINFMTGEAWVNDTLVTDFSTIFDNFDGARMDSSGYDQTDGDGALQAKGALLAALAPLNWAVRAEADISPTQVNPFPSLMGAVDSTWDNGMELQFNTSFGADEFKATFSDNMGDYAEGAPFRSGVHVFAASNNPTTGWSLAIDGGSALHQEVQSVWTASKISFGSDTDNTGAMYDHFSGYQRIWQFFPLMPDEGLIDLSLNDGTDARPAWLHAEAEFGINFMVGEAYVTGRLYTDLSEVLRGNFDPANLSASGYTQVDATDGMKVDFGLLNRMSRMDWAMCMEWNASGAAQSFNVIEGTGTSTLTGFEMWRSSANGDLMFGDYNSTYANAGTLRGYQSLDGKFTPATYKVAMSNNAEGWVASMAGQTATTSTGQTPPGTNHIAIGCGLSGNMPADAINGTIKKIEFFPRMQATQLQTLATVTLPKELPGYRGVGTAASVATPTATLTPTMPAGTVTNDYIFLAVETNSGDVVPTPSGYTLIGAGVGTNSRMTVFGRRATASNPNPSVTRVGDHTTARIVVVKGAITSGNPWEALATGALTGDPLNLPTLTTTVDQSLVLQFISTGVDSTTNQYSAFTNTSLRAYSDRMSTYQITGDGGGFAMGGGWKETAGVVNASTVTHALSSESVGYVSFSVKPA